MKHECETGEEGFTLVELLVAISLLAILSGLFVNTVVLSQRMAGVSGRLVSSQEIDAVERYLRRDLRQVFKIFQLDPKAKKLHLVFRGGPDQLDLVLSANIDVEYGGLRYVSFLIDESGDAGPRLITRRQPGGALGENTVAVKTSEVVLLENISSLSFRYYGTGEDKGRQTTGWFDVWGAVGQLPRLVELNIVQNVEGHRTERQIVVDLPLAR
ncbi:prepilin-type N-terminal cleavage/methylation domain-containing protein [Anderseniella sp. Alg231-50]|uniref:prepilin-type N-terminal cleavage/methylation domain-containing protein n=1 Tax=Anderseniella sp. Alg231-50 TaxID=1922226 RepID=UPI000D55C2BA